MCKLISMIIPVYNSGSKLKKCIQSILNQTYSNLEVIVVNDGSSDDETRYVLDSLKKIDRRIKLYNKKNEGALSARMFGVKNASGYYIMFVDADDWIEPDMLMGYIECCHKYDYDYILGGLCIEYTNKRIKKNRILDEECVNDKKKIKVMMEKYFLNEAIYGPYCKLIKTTILKNVLLELQEYKWVKLQEDLIMNVKILKQVKSIKTININKYHYEINEGTITTKYIANKLEMMMCAFDEISFFYGNLFIKTNYDELKFIYIKNIYAGFINLFHKDCTLNKKAKKIYIRKWMNFSKTEQILKNINCKNLPLEKKILTYIFKYSDYRMVFLISKLLYYIKRWC